MNQAPPAESRVSFWPLGLVLAWAGFVFYRYFFAETHLIAKAWPALGELFDAGSFSSATGPGVVEAWKGFAGIFLTVFLIVGVTWAWGRRIRLWLSLDPTDSWIRFAVDFGLGVCVLNFFWVGTGLTRLWYQPVWMTAGAASLLLFAWELVVCFKQRVRGGWAGFFPKDVGYFFLVAVGLFYWVFSIFQNLAPETFYDSMVYHLAVPNYWLFHHGLADFPSNFFSNYPFGAETYFLNGLVSQGTESAKMLHAVSFGVCALLAGGWAREIAGTGLGLGQPRPLSRHTQGLPLDSKVSGQGGSEKAGWLTLGLVLTLPLFAVNTWSTQVEGLLSLAVILFLYALNHFIRNEEKRMAWALVAGLFLGLALSIKYTAFLVLFSALVVLVIQKPAVLKMERWKSWGAMKFGALLLLGPWLLKNLATTGNPFFPYLMSYFPGRHLTSFGYRQLLQEQHARVTTEWWSWLLLPWNLTLSNPDSYNFCGPLALALVPLLFLFRLKHPVLRFLAGAAPLLLVAGFAVTHILRFVLPAFVLYYILLGAVLAGGNRPAWGKGIAWGAGVSAVLCFAYLAVISHFYYSCAGLWSGRQTRAEYLTGSGKITPYTPMARWVSENTSSEARLLVVGDARGLYYERSFLTNTVFDEQVLSKIAREEKDPEGIGRRLKKLGVDYLVVNGLEGIRVSADYHHYDLTSAEWKRLDGFIQGGTTLVYSVGFQSVHRLLPKIEKSPADETLDLLLFFSDPASKFVRAVQAKKWDEAKENLSKAVALYPFSKFWQNQKIKFEKALQAAHG
jgi:hypothetical protein